MQWGAVQCISKKTTLKVDDKEYELTPGLILYKKPRPQHYTSDDYPVYKAIVAQTRVRTYPNKRTGSARPHSTWKWKHMLSGMVMPGDMIEEDEESTEGTNSDGFRTPAPTTSPSGGKTRKKRKTKEPFYKGYGVYLPGNIKGLTDKLHLLLAEFIAGNTTVRMLRLKQLTRREYTDINNRLASACEWGNCTTGPLLARYATKAMSATLRGSVAVAKRAVPHVITCYYHCQEAEKTRKGCGWQSCA